MRNQSRREFLRRGSVGLAAVGTGALLLRADARATEPSGELGAYGEYVRGENGRAIDPAAREGGEREGGWLATEPNILGPFYREGAPFRGKITPPLEPGRVVLISGVVFALDTRRPLPNTVIDIWQANRDGRYDNDDPRSPPREDVFLNRARLITDENGRYEYETIYPGQYLIGPEQWRPSHIHYWVRHPRYEQLITQLYFKGDPHNETDPFIRPSLIIELHERGEGERAYLEGVFDIVLDGG